MSHSKLSAIMYGMRVEQEKKERTRKFTLTMKKDTNNEMQKGLPQLRITGMSFR